jgi:LysR family transcriptional regulator, transcriptional activator of the cysJI operon
MALNLHLLRIFFTVAERTSFSRAAEALAISQPAVSKAVRALERQLDLPLIERGAGGSRPRGVQLTEAGAALCEHARGIFALERAAAEDIRARTGLRRGRLAIGASTTVAGYWLPPYAARFARAFPAAELRVGVGNTQAIGQALIDCRVDVALVEGQVEDPRIEATLWRHDELRIAVPARSPLLRHRLPTAAELNAALWLLREPGSGTREVTERLLRARQLAPKRTLEIGSNEGIARAVAAGLGIALLPACVIRELVQTGAVRTLQLPARPQLLRPLYLLRLKQRPASPLLRAFCATLARPLEEPAASARAL